MKRMVKKNYKIIVGIIIGLMVSSIGVYAVNTLAGNEVSYNNDTSGLTSNTVQDAIDELYNKADAQKKKMPKPDNENIVSSYFYNQVKESDDYCVTGDEDTCKVNTCYLNKAANSCEPGTIIEYNVKEGEKIRFHVVHDDGKKITLQSQEDTVDNTMWYSDMDNAHGPTTVLEALKRATNDWMNVNKFDYSIGDGNSTLKYSGLSGDHSISATPYQLLENSVRVRMITLQETLSVGCKDIYFEPGVIISCPIWMYNYLHNSKSYDGTEEGEMDYYWTMTSSIWPGTVGATTIDYSGNPGWHTVTSSLGARAVVEINK